MADNGTKKGKFDSKMELAVEALLTEPTIEAAAARAKIGLRTLHRWMETPEFDALYRHSKRKIINFAISRLQQATGEAVQVLRDIMNDTDNPASARVTAARTVIEQALRAVELEELVERVEALEKIVEGKGA